MQDISFTIQNRGEKITEKIIKYENTKDGIRKIRTELIGNMIHHIAGRDFMATTPRGASLYTGIFEDEQLAQELINALLLATNNGEVKITIEYQELV